MYTMYASSFSARDHMENNSRYNKNSLNSPRPMIAFESSTGIRVSAYKDCFKPDEDVYAIQVSRNLNEGAENTSEWTHFVRAGDLLRLQELLVRADQFIESEEQKDRTQLCRW